MPNTNRAAIEAAHETADQAFAIAARNLRNARARAKVDAAAAYELALATVIAAREALEAAIDAEYAAALEAANAPDAINLAFNF